VCSNQEQGTVYRKTKEPKDLGYVITSFDMAEEIELTSILCLGKM